MVPEDELVEPSPEDTLEVNDIVHFSCLLRTVIGILLRIELSSQDRFIVRFSVRNVGGIATSTQRLDSSSATIRDGNDSRTRQDFATFPSCTMFRSR